MPNDILPLHVKNIHFNVDGEAFIKNISFTLNPGKPTLIIGPNGAGKTLLMRLCHGLIRPTKGEIMWKGPAQNPQLHQAMVFQTPIMLRRSVIENAEYPLKLRRVSKADRMGKVENILEKAGLKNIAERQAHHLSGGEKQRLSIARAWIMEPEVMFLDEPTANLDPRGVKDIEILIRNIAKTGTKVVMTTHQIDQIKRLNGEVMFLHKGEILEYAGNTRDFVQNPKTPHAKAYLEGALIV